MNDDWSVVSSVVDVVGGREGVILEGVGSSAIVVNCVEWAVVAGNILGA